MIFTISGLNPTQQRFWPDPQPLVERLGRDFFRNLPERPGVYLMRDAGEAVLYVGKAKNLRKRLGSYRVANPERMPRRHMRLLRSVVKIELQECADERAALSREAELLRTLKPRFNRAGTWPGQPRFLLWRIAGHSIELVITASPEAGWNASGPMGGGAVVLRAVLARLIWMAVQPEPGLSGMPVGWMHGKMDATIVIGCGTLLEPLAASLETLLSRQPAPFCGWIRARLGPDLHPFEKTVVEADLESVADLVSVAKP